VRPRRGDDGRAGRKDRGRGRRLSTGNAAALPVDPGRAALRLGPQHFHTDQDRGIEGAVRDRRPFADREALGPDERDQSRAGAGEIEVLGDQGRVDQRTAVLANEHRDLAERIEPGNLRTCAEQAVGDEFHGQVLLERDDAHLARVRARSRAEDLHGPSLQAPMP
jgi:hypothetical protein